MELPLLYLNVPSSERKAKVEAVLDRMAMMHRRNHFPQQLSGGQQQRVAIARAIVAKPQLIRAEEPTGNLHSKQAKEIMEVFKKLNEEGATIIQVTHSEDNARYGNRIIDLVDGMIKNDKKTTHFV